MLRKNGFVWDAVAELGRGFGLIFSMKYVSIFVEKLNRVNVDLRILRILSVG